MQLEVKKVGQNSRKWSKYWAGQTIYGLRLYMPESIYGSVTAMLLDPYCKTFPKGRIL
jgi:hypothetical protein